MKICQSRWGSYVAKVADAPYRITDADVGTLKAAGYREEQIFEVTIAAALGAALRGIDAGLRVVGESEDETGDT